MSVRLRTKWLWVWTLLMSLKLQVWHLLRAVSFLTFRQTIEYRFSLKLVRDMITYSGIMLAEKCVNNVIYVKRYNHCCLQLRFLVGTTILNVICCYAPQSVLSTDTFYEMINSMRIYFMKEYLAKLHLYQRKRC